MTQGKTKAVIYARFSPRPNADESESNERQIERCQEYARVRGYKVVAVYSEPETSGGDDDRKVDPAEAVRKRQGLIDALDALQPGWVLLVRWRSRLARDPYLEEWCHRRAESIGARIEAADENNDVDPAATLVRGILAEFRRYERLMTKERTRRAMRRHQAAGRRMGRADRAPWGFMVDPQDATRLIPCPEEQEIAETIVRLHTQQGLGLRAICRCLEQHGLKRRGKDTWNHVLVKDILERAGALRRAEPAP